MYTILLNIIIYELMHGVLLYQTNNNGDAKANIVKKKKIIDTGDILLMLIFIT